MDGRDISTSKNPILRGSFPALRRAAEMARQLAIQTRTNLVVYQDGKVVLIPPEELIEQDKRRKSEAS